MRIFFLLSIKFNKFIHHHLIVISASFLQLSYIQTIYAIYTHAHLHIWNIKLHAEETKYSVTYIYYGHHHLLKLSINCHIMYVYLHIADHTVPKYTHVISVRDFHVLFFSYNDYYETLDHSISVK